MDWSTIPVELLERILVFTQSPKAVGNALIACKTWRDVDHYQHLWQDLFQNITGCRISGEPAVDWKKKVTDLVLVRKNVKDGRCVVRTLATSHGAGRRTTLDIENPSVYKDYFLCGWLKNSGSGSHVIDMVKEEVVEWAFQQVLFMNQYVASTPSSYFGGAMCSEVKVQKFDPKKIPTFTPSDSVRFNMQPQHRNLVRNYYPDSNYIGFTSYSYGGSSYILVIDAESGNRAFSLEVEEFRQVQLYDAYLVMSRDPDWVEVIDVSTHYTLGKQYIPKDYELGFMTDDTLAIRTEGKIILWNFIEDTEVVYPAGQVPMSNIEVMYHDMWLVYDKGKLSFYDTEDGSLINTLALRAGSTTDHVLSLLSDDRICVATRNGCRVISFIDSEVNRKIEVDLMDVDGTVTTHEISAHELPQFFVEKVEKPYEMMISRVVEYPPKEANSANERFVLICTQDEKNKTSPENTTATKLLQTKIGPTCVNTPYQAWKFDNQAIIVKDLALDRVCGRAILVREVKINGRWQLASMSE